jgi:molybdopterin/thiamine biosynthesis adenylyltransferase
MPYDIADQLASAATNELETAGVILAGFARTSSGLRLLARELHFFADTDYDDRRRDGMSIPSRAYLSTLARADDLHATPILFHTHPSGAVGPRPSEWDDIVDEQLCETFRVRSGSDIYASVIVSPNDTLFSFTGRGTDGTRPFAIDRALVVGDRLALLTSFDQPVQSAGAMFDRQVRAFGGDVQNALGQLRVGVVGCGGTGSAVIEQLARLGVRDFVLIDNDELAATNVTRVYGSTPRDVGRTKVHVLADHLRAIASDSTADARVASVLDQTAARALTGCDLLFGCTDDNAGRLVLTRLAAYYLVPYFDCGVLISSNGVVDAIHGRVTVQTPGAACLACRNRIDLERARAEQLSDDERIALQREGYAPELGGVEPAVVTFTTAVASQAVTEVLERFIGFGGEPVPTEVILRCHDRNISTNRAEPRPGHYCHPGTGALGIGDSDPFLGQLWKVA